MIIGFLMKDSNLNIMHAMFVMIWQYDVSDIAIITVKNVDYRCIIHTISKSEAHNLLKNSVLEDRGYI